MKRLKEIDPSEPHPPGHHAAQSQHDLAQKADCLIGAAPALQHGAPDADRQRVGAVTARRIRLDRNGTGEGQQAGHSGGQIAGIEIQLPRGTEITDLQQIADQRTVPALKAMVLGAHRADVRLAVQQRFDIADGGQSVPDPPVSA